METDESREEKRKGKRKHIVATDEHMELLKTIHDDVKKLTRSSGTVLSFASFSQSLYCKLKKSLKK